MTGAANSNRTLIGAQTRRALRRADSFRHFEEVVVLKDGGFFCAADSALKPAHNGQGP
jgi:hypothetical protein